jgi:hypothetical protein
VAVAVLASTQVQWIRHRLVVQAAVVLVMLALESQTLAVVVALVAWHQIQVAVQVAQV